MKNIHKSPRLLFVIFTVVYIFTSCEKTKTTSAEYNVDLNASGPFFQGGNSFIADFKPDLSKISSETAIANENLKSIGIKKAIVTLNPNDSISFEMFNSATLQLVSDNIAMQSIAVLNPISTSENQIELTVSNEVELLDFFKEEVFTVLLDLDFAEDDYKDDMNVELKLELNIDYKTK